MSQMIQINRQERNAFRRWLEDAEGVLGDLGMIVLGRLDVDRDELFEMRRHVEFLFVSLDQIGWSMRGNQEHYKLPATAELREFVGLHRARQASQVADGELDRPRGETEIETCDRILGQFESCLAAA